MKRLSISILFIILTQQIHAIPPRPPDGMRWILQEELSDEFNGNSLDVSKWNDYYPGWEGRPPAKFVSDAISVKHGLLHIKNGVLENPDDTFWISGGAVTTKSSEASYGYYECRAKASRINMSTTFWMSNEKVLLNETDECRSDEYSLELDIQEAVGGSQENPKFRYQMHSNTHYRHIACGETKEKFYSKGAQKNLASEVWEAFHTYGAWWEDEEKVHFYADDDFFATVRFTKEISRHPFNRPMHLNMVTETYNWQPPPSIEDLQNDAINTSFYDWVRSYRLVGIDEKVLGSSNKIKLYDESIELTEVPDTIFGAETFELGFVYRANIDRILRIEIFEGKKTQIQTLERTVLAGYGSGSMTLGLKFTPDPSRHYKIMATLVESDSDGKTLDAVAYDVSL